MARRSKGELGSHPPPVAGTRAPRLAPAREGCWVSEEVIPL